jgi:hypothetical protein
MTTQINSNYLENYSKAYAAKVCDSFYGSRQYMTGQDIVQLTNSIQVNFFVIKRLFELWQDELGKLKSNPYFDYRDISVHEALTQFMNVLSRRIKVERVHLEPLLREAVSLAIQVATDPVSFYQSEISKAPKGKISDYLKENKKYYKWHDRVVAFLIDKTGFGHDEEAYIRAVATNYQAISDSLESTNLLLATLGDVQAFDLDQYLIGSNSSPVVTAPEGPSEKEPSFFESLNEEVENEVKESMPVKESFRDTLVVEAPVSKPVLNFGKSLNSSELRSHFSTLTYKGMKGVLGELSESLAINQRFMFTKELFDGNSDLLKHALKSIDSCSSFDEAIQLINQKFVGELGWETDSEAVYEFALLVYRKFDEA